MSHMAHENPRNPYYMPDTSTVIKRPKGSAAPTLAEGDLRGRVLRALNKEGRSGSHLHVTIPLPPEPPGTRAASQPKTLPPRPVRRASNHAFSREYVAKRMNRCIAKAQDDGDFDEAIRLQHLLWALEDERLSPVETAREAWLRPAADDPAKFRE